MRARFFALLTGCAWAAALTAALSPAQAQAQAPQWSGQLRWLATPAQANSLGPAAQANALRPGTVAAPFAGSSAQALLEGQAAGWNAAWTLQQGDDATDLQSGTRALYWAHSDGAWEWSAGRRVVGWDVGQGWRPNDLVQQEDRRTLVSTPATGRGVLMLQHFGEGSAWALAAVNPGASPQDRLAQEPAVVARAYWQQGVLDLHAFARQGARTGASAGTALAWVADDALELHTSLRWLQDADTRELAPGTSGIAAANPWRDASTGSATQALVGGTWTYGAWSTLLEAWWDGTALSDAQWDAWNARNAELQRLAALGAPASAVAGNLAWQLDALGARANLRRHSVLLRQSWQEGAWSAALEWLYTPADRGSVATASLQWQGDRVRLEAGVRSSAGPQDAVLAQTPSARSAYVVAAWAF
ncbi:MAG: hypothetical protein ACT4NV_04920 [Rhodoferax sp.]